MTTHSPLFVNPAADHTTIIRLEREDAGDNLAPNLFRTDEAGFTGDEKAVLQAIQEMDPTFCEVFFGTFPIIVEGNTEHAAFIAAAVEAELLGKGGEQPPLIPRRSAKAPRVGKTLPKWGYVFPGTGGSARTDVVNA
jgi:hypothetical protein